MWPVPVENLPRTTGRQQLTFSEWLKCGHDIFQRMKKVSFGCPFVEALDCITEKGASGTDAAPNDRN